MLYKECVIAACDKIQYQAGMGKQSGRMSRITLMQFHAGREGDEVIQETLIFGSFHGLTKIHPFLNIHTTCIEILCLSILKSFVET